MSRDGKLCKCAAYEAELATVKQQLDAERAKVKKAADALTRHDPNYSWDAIEEALAALQAPEED